MQNKTYNIFSKLRQEIEEFDRQGIYIVGKPSPRDQFGTEKGLDGGYYFSQKEMLEAIDLACASKFKRGHRDDEGKRKTYLNIVNFHKEVSLNQVGVNVSNYILSPESPEWEWPVLFMDKRFKEWAEKNSYDDIIDELADDFVGKGSTVSKKVRGGVERVPLRTIRITQSAKSIKHAVNNGGFFIIENEMSYNEMAKYPDWDLSDLDKDKTYCVFERYSLIPKAILVQGERKPTTEEWNEMVLAVQILLPNEKTLNGKAGEENGVIAFLAEIDDIGEYLEEAHYSKVDGRWLGVGEVEKQLENQIARNLTVNLRRRSMLWAVKKLFQSSDPDVKRNLLMEAKDGEVIEVKQNGQISQVNTQSQHTGDFALDEKSWAENSRQISFSFEAASGESMPSGTPFRLGVILSAAVSKYFKRKQDTFSNFLKRSFFEQIIPTFRKENKDAHTLIYDANDDNYEQVREAMIVLHTNARVKASWMQKKWISYEDARKQVEDEISKTPLLFVDAPEDFYKDPQCYMKLNINEPISADVETLTTLYQSMAAKNDPRAERVLRAIFSAKGKSLSDIIGPTPKAPVTPALNPSDTTRIEAPVEPANATA